MNVLVLTGIACLLFDATPSTSLRWSYSSGLQSTSFVSLSNQRLGNPYTRSTLALKDSLNPNRLEKYGTQVYGVATYDALFKWILDDAGIRRSFFQAFIPGNGINVTSSERLDESMNPLQKFQLLRKFVNNKDTQKTVENLKLFSEFEVRIKKINQTEYSQFDKGTDFLAELLKYFGDIITCFPSENYDGRMDFVCRLDTGEYALVETQIIRQDYWDRRALAYIAAFMDNKFVKVASGKILKR